MIDVCELTDDDDSFGRQLANLRKTINDVMDKSSKIANNIKTAEMSSNRSQAEVEQAQEAIKRADTALQTAEAYIDDQGRKALKRAQEALSKFGQQSTQMTELARRAQSESLRY